MKKLVTLGIYISLFYIIDNSVMPFLSIKGYYPSILFIFVLCYSVINEKWSAFGIGIVSGILQDIYFFKGFGINTLLNMILCICAGEVGKNLFKEKSFIPVLTVAFLTFCKGVLTFLFLRILGIHTNIYNPVFNAVYSLVITIFLYKHVYKLCQKEYMIRKWKFESGD